MTDFKAAAFLIFVSLILLGAVLFVKLQASIVSAVALVVVGIMLLSVFVKVVAK